MIVNNYTCKTFREIYMLPKLFLNWEKIARIKGTVHSLQSSEKKNLKTPQLLFNKMHKGKTLIWTIITITITDQKKNHIGLKLLITKYQDNLVHYILFINNCIFSLPFFKVTMIFFDFSVFEMILKRSFSNYANVTTLTPIVHTNLPGDASIQVKDCLANWFLGRCISHINV